MVSSWKKYCTVAFFFYNDGHNRQKTAHHLRFSVLWPTYLNVVHQSRRQGRWNRQKSNIKKLPYCQLNSPIQKAASWRSKSYCCLYNNKNLRDSANTRVYMSASGMLPMTITKCNRTLKCLFVKRCKNNMISVSGFDRTPKKTTKANNNNALRCLILFQLCKHAIKTSDLRKQSWLKS